jgi:uncharacterized protein DUF222
MRIEPNSTTSSRNWTRCTLARPQRDLLRGVAQVDHSEAWRGSGARDMAHWLAMRYGISEWKARRWIAASHALEHLPRTSEALAAGELGLDKVVELTRFAAPETEDRLLQYWYTEDRFGLRTELPAACGPIITKALERVAESIPDMPGAEEDPYPQDAKRAGALVALCSARISADPDPDRATVVVHARLEGLVSGSGGCEIRGRSRDPSRDRAPAALHRSGPDRDRERSRRGRAHRADATRASGLDAAAARAQGPGVSGPRLREPALRPGAPPHVVEPRRTDRAREPGAHLLVPPQAGARARLDDQP